MFMAMKEARDPHHIHRKSRICSDSRKAELVRWESPERGDGRDASSPS